MATTEPSVRPISNPNRSPSYPQRVHIRERAQWQKLLADVEGRIAAMFESPAAKKPGAERELAQLVGVRDQIADAVRRLPMETGELYEEDVHRVRAAEQALERVLARLGG